MTWIWWRRRSRTLSVHVDDKEDVHRILRFLYRESKYDGSRSFTLYRDHKQEDGTRVKISLGPGVHRFEYGGKTFYVRKDHSEDMMRPPTLVLSTREGSLEDVQRLSKDAEQYHMTSEVGRYSIWTWNCREQYNCWEHVCHASHRSFDTVILDRDVKRRLLEDIAEFTSDTNRTWYKKHQIPYRRGYLLHGPPGTGKTSTIGAMATLLKRDVYRINLVNAGMDDASLLSAVSECDSDESEPGIVIMEDVDALFDHHREKREHTMVTFSGLLNAIDGLRSSENGTIYVFTTNHIQKLDAALKRRGRIDADFFLDSCTTEQAKDMFRRFYDGCDDQNASRFATSVMRYAPVAPANLQNHFVKHRADPEADSCVFELEPRDDDETACRSIYT